MSYFKYLPVLFILLISSVYSQRQVKTLNSGWNFHLADSKHSNTVNLPHTWNARDAFEEDKTYHRGTGIYSKRLFAPETWKDRSIFLKFEGANQVTRVYVNEDLAGEHKGGYTGFVFEISNFLNYGTSNEIRIEVDNTHDMDIPPLEADFNFYGGIYRDLQLIITGKSHFKLEGKAAGNLLISTPRVNKELAEIRFSGEVVNTANSKLKLQIRITDPVGKTVFNHEKQLQSSDFLVDIKIEDPMLWSPDKPELYTLKANLLSENGGILDSFSSAFGCRWFQADPEKGFILNGNPIKLIGANRHQDFENLGNALPNAIHRKDYQMIKDMGANFIRTAHYPQDPEVYQICDELGLLVWTEIPVINDVTDSEAYHQNSINMQREQILQLYNHPSIVFWGYMNEIFIRMVFTGDMSEADRKEKIRTSLALAEKLEAETKKLDTSRLSVMALHQNEVYNSSGIADIPDVIGWNLYFGWYTQGLENLGEFLDEQNKKYPDRPILISEYGPGSDTRIQTNDPKPWDFSEAYQLKSHVSYLNQVMERDYMLGMAAWNFADFGSSGRQDSRPFINQKGLVNFDRQPKDIYYYYKARLSTEDFAYIAGENFENRILKQGEPVTIKVFSNNNMVILSIDDDKEISARVTDNIAKFSLDLKAGDHHLQAVSGDAKHHQKINVKFRDELLQDLNGSPLLINVGSHSNFIDDETGEVWIADREFSNNKFGFSGGKVYQQSENKSQGSASNIKLTNKEPLFQTMREGLDSYNFEVPAGVYQVSLLFTEPNRGVSTESIYNLGSDTQENSTKSRIFDILINEFLVEENLNLAADYGILQAVELNYEVATDGNIKVEFNEKSGGAVLSAIKLEKI